MAMKTSQRIRPNSSDSDLVNNNSPLLPTRLDDKQEDANMTKGSMPDFGRNVKLLFCFVGLQISYVLWGVVQEQLMTQEYKFGKFKSSAFCVFGNRFLALFISLAIVIFRGLTSTKPMKIAPYYWYAPSSLSNSLSSWAQYEALKFVSFPTQVLSKSCKIIPVMLVRTRTNFEINFL
jgi:UAA transporter family